MTDSNDKLFAWPVRIYHEDVDTMGIVYYANYLKYYERSRTEYLRAIGYEQDNLMRELGVMFVVKAVNLEYLLPGRFNDLLMVTSDVSSFRRSSFNFDQKIYRDNLDDEPLNKAMVTIVCVDTKKVRPCSIPESLLEKLHNTITIKS